MYKMPKIFVLIFPIKNHTFVEKPGGSSQQKKLC